MSAASEWCSDSSLSILGKPGPVFPRSKEEWILRVKVGAGAGVESPPFYVLVLSEGGSSGVMETGMFLSVRGY